jgi:uncharacterized protein (UPF0335 family)
MNGLVIAQTDALTILPNGNVGVGTTTPTQKLDVHGNIQSLTGFIGHAGLGNKYASFSLKKFGNQPSNYAILQRDDGVTFLNSATGNPLYFTQGNTVKMVLDPNGHFGIGTTNPNYAKLQIGGGDTHQLFALNRANSDVPALYLGNKNTNDAVIASNNSNLIFGRDKSGTYTEYMRIQNETGNVGIGIDKPNAKLYINSKASDPATVGTNALTIGSSNPDDGRLQMGISKGYSWIQSHGAKPLIINKHNTVGIGTTSPTQAKLVVSGSVNHTPKFLRQDIFGGKFYQDEIINKLTTSNSKIPYSIYASGHIAAQQFSTFSDARIKNIVGQSNATKDLEILSKIEITDYTMIDTISKGNQTHKKVIAQQVKEVYPQAVSSDLIDVIPNIYTVSTIKDGWIQTNTKELVVGDKVKLIFSEEEALVSVLEIQGEAIKVASNQEGHVFVYGKQVSDFHTVDYEAISMLNVSATQALLKRIEALEQEKKKLTGDFENYKTSVNDRLSKIEQTLATETAMN